MSSLSSHISLRRQRMATTTHQHDPTKRLLNQYTLNAITIILLAILINQPSWCLETTIYTNNNASSSISDQNAYDQNAHQYNSYNPSKYQPTAYNDAQQSLDTRLKTVPSEQYHRQIQPATTSMNYEIGGGGGSNTTTTRLTSSQVMSQSNVRPLGMQQQQSPSPNSDSNATGQRRNRDSDSSLIEGSGDGPVSGSQKHQPTAKFDDTEEGEDDDDEDYDYKDSSDTGSGHINQPSVIKKPSEPDQALGSSQLKKPNSANNDEAYLPFRPATSGKPPTTIAPPLLKPTTRESSEMFPTILQNTTKSNGRAMDSNATETELVIVQSTTRNPQIIKPSPPYTTSRGPKQNLPPIYTTTSPSLVPHIDNQLKTPDVQMSTLSPVSTKHKLHHNSLSSGKNSSKFSDIDYDYEDENDDEDSDDVSNFEDNDAQVENQQNTQNSTSIPQSVTPNKHLTANSTIITNITIPPQAITTTAMPKPTMSTKTTPRPTSNQMNYSNFSHHPTVSKFLTQNHVPTMAPPMLSPSSESSLDVNDEDDDDSKLDEEELEDDDDDDDDGDDDNEAENISLPTQSTSKPSPQSNSPTNILPPAPPRWPPTPPPQSPSTQTPNFVNEQYPKPETNIHQTTTLTQPGHIMTQMPSPTVSSTSPRVTKTTTPATPPPTSTSTSSTTSTTTTTTTTTKPPTTTTSAPPLPPVKPTLAPFFTSSSTTVRPVSIKYATTPRIRTTPTTPVTRIPNVMKPPDISNLPDGDIELTRQIYDKAVEVYQATNKAISAAVEAIWPPSFEVNSVTFEPFLIQPFLFMFVLGAAIIGLVLTMMLVVYIISYQSQPKEDEDVSIYSHS